MLVYLLFIWVGSMFIIHISCYYVHSSLLLISFCLWRAVYSLYRSEGMYIFLILVVEYGSVNNFWNIWLFLDWDPFYSLQWLFSELLLLGRGVGLVLKIHLLMIVFDCIVILTRLVVYWCDLCQLFLRYCHKVSYDKCI